MLVIKLLIFFLVGTASTFALNVDERDKEEGVDISQGSRPSDIPTGGIFRDLHEINIDAFRDADISAHPDKKIYAGYGIYDPKQEHCAKVDVGNGEDPLYSGEFIESSLQIFNGHAYLMSSQKMSYSQCVSRANNFFAYPAIPTTEAEESFLTYAYSNDNRIWLGLYKSQRDIPYINAKGAQQNFFNFHPKDNVYNNSRKAVSKIADYWNKTDETTNNYCVIEFETDDYKRPIKVCAPWWTIERTYPLPESSRYLVNSVDEDGNIIQVDVRKFNKALFPKSVKICVERNTSTTTAEEGDMSRVICNSYYSIDRSPVCQQNLIQNVCFVDECRGAIKNSCELKATEDAPLPYSKKVVIDANGNEKWIKGRDKIQMHSYECDLFSATAQCTMWSDVMMLPIECPKDDPNAQSVYVYGNPTRPIGNPVRALLGTCPNGETVEVPVDIISTTTRRCLRYQWIEEENVWAESCVQERPYLDHTVHIDINEHDIYQEDPLCVRLNNINDARPPQMTQIKFRRKGYAALIFKKAHIEGAVDDFSPVPLTTSYIETVLDNMKWNEESNSSNTSSPIDGSKLPLINCEEDSIYNEIYNDFMVGFIANNTLKNEIGNLLKINNSRTAKVNNLTWFQCRALATNISTDSGYALDVLIPSESLSNIEAMDPLEIQNLQQQYNETYRANEHGVSIYSLITPDADEEDRGQCLLNITGIPNDFFDDVTGFDPFTMKTLDNMPFKDCRKFALCTHSDYLNAKDYTAPQPCEIRFGEGAGETTELEYQNEIDAAMSNLIEEAQEDSKTPREVLEQDEDAYEKTSEWVFGIDGTKDIFYIQEYVPPLKGWGYLPSYNFLAYESSTVSINNNQIWPIIQHYKSEDILKMRWLSRSNAYRFYGSSSSFVNATAFVGDTGGWSSRPESFAYNFMLGGITNFGLGWLVSGIATLAEGPKKEFEADVSASIVGLKSDLKAYKRNFYPQYEGREIDPSDENVINYAYTRYKTNGRLDRSDENRFYSTIPEILDDFFETLNVFDPPPPYAEHYPPKMTSLVKKYPKLKWYELYRSKSTGWKEEQGEMEIRRYVTTHYMGAVNGISIIVPYNGDYDIYAYDSVGSLVATATVKEADFIKRFGFEYSFSAALPKLGEHMNLVLPEALACKEKNMVSIGGGVAGSYFEVNDKSSNYRPYVNCGEADHQYVEEHAITQLRIKLSNTDKYYIINLDYPLPYPNRVFLVSMENPETREYRCFLPWSECSDYEKYE